MGGHSAVDQEARQLGSVQNHSEEVIWEDHDSYVMKAKDHQEGGSVPVEAPSIQEVAASRGPRRLAPECST
jgi:hypothetical protein